MRPYLSSMQVVRRGDWLIKASALDDQIMVFLYNDVTMDYLFKMFYNEEIAYNFIESLYDKNCKVSNG